MVRAAAIQMNSGADVQQNLQTIDNLLAAATSRGVSIAFLPENLAIMGARDEDKLAHAEDPGSGPIQEYLADAARRYKLWVVAGSVPLKSPQDGKCYGASIVYDNDGRASPIYRKRHLFDVDLPGRDERYRESATMDFGNDFVVVPSPLGQLGLSICYDLRFPEHYRRLVDDGATVFSIPAAFTVETGKAHWHSLLRARAIENLAYVIAAGQHGSHPSGRTTFGHSVIIDPWGQVIAELESGDGIVDADIDTALPGKLRAEFPVLEHRRI
ncbi:MAG: carbon-nitrogen hydrolase family protein [Proteobacteria bacterium]|nr:carbon-nitrogen hydrolase family protein [Pseudomonadota bacterium]